jgi:hypothetical protein
VYSIRQLPGRAGLGPVRVFRALPNAVGQRHWPVDQTPQNFITSLPAFNALMNAVISGGDLAGAAAHLASQNIPMVEKSWTEVIFEAVRLQVVPDAPSRQTALWAFEDPLQAFALTEQTATAYRVFEAEVLDGVPWRVVDMSAFRVPQLASMGHDSFEAAEPELRVLADHYWLMDQPEPVREVLVGGAMRLTSPALDLLAWMRDAGLIQASH